MEDSLVSRIEEGVATVILNRPAAYNTLSVDMLDKLPELLQSLSDNDDVRCVVLTGAGKKAFCAGGDISALATGSGDSANGQADNSELSERLVGWGQAALMLREMPKPTLAVINGAVAGAGLALATACDFRLASHNAHFTTAFSNLAMSGDFGGSYFLSQLVGTAKARELYYFSERVSSEEALQLGLVNWLVESDALLAKTQQLTQRLAVMPRLTASSIKKNMNSALYSNAKDMIHQESYAMIETAMSKETQQAAMAFFANAKK